MAVNFKSKEAYGKWLSYGHMHDVFHGKQKVTIKGKPHKVSHKNYSPEIIRMAKGKIMRGDK